MTAPANRRLHLGCGRDILPGWTNLDIAKLPGVDVVADLDDCQRTPLPFPDNSVSEFLASHVLEHLRNPLPLMQELYRIATPGAKMVIRVPYGSSDDAFEDPTHHRQYFPGSFTYFSQPNYWRADYGYRGDWVTEKVTLSVDKERYDGVSPEQVIFEVKSLRNVVREMAAELRAVKPARAPRQELQIPPEVDITLV